MYNAKTEWLDKESARFNMESDISEFVASKK